MDTTSPAIRLTRRDRVQLVIIAYDAGLVAPAR
jgi:hypothetical protein